MKTVLVVDDSQTIRTAVVWTLRGPDFQVLESNSGASARECLTRERPDILLIDVDLGSDEDGFGLCTWIKGTPGLAETPVVLMGSAHDPLDLGRVESVQADGHIHKPFDTQTLIELVRHHVGLPPVDDAPLTYAGRLARERAQSTNGRSSAPTSVPAETLAPPPPPPMPFSAPPVEGPRSELEVNIDEEEPIEIDAEELEPVPQPVERRAAPVPATYDASSTDEPLTDEPAIPTGPSLEPPPSPAAMSPRPSVDVWSLADEPSGPEGPPPVPPPSAPPMPARSEAFAPAVARIAETTASATAERVSVPGLDREELRALAREVIEQIAWEVVPDLAETIIREEIARLTREP